MSWRQVADSVSHAAEPKPGLCASRSLEAFLRELPVPLARAGPMLPAPRNAGDLEALVGMQQLQLTFVYGKVLSKKTRVRAPSDPPDSKGAGDTRSLRLWVSGSESWSLCRGRPTRPPVFPGNCMPGATRLRGRRLTSAAPHSRKLPHAWPVASISILQVPCPPAELSQSV